MKTLLTSRLQITGPSMILNGRYPRGLARERVVKSGSGG